MKTKSYTKLPGGGGIVIPDNGTIGRAIEPGEQVTCNCCCRVGSVKDFEAHESVIRYLVSFQDREESHDPMWVQPNEITPCIDP